MSSNNTTRAQIQVHICVVIWGFTAILGKMISLAALPLVWWRMLLVSVALLTLPRVWRGLAAMSWRTRAAYAGIGVLIAMHWLTFYGAVKLANASVAATCIAIAPVFLAVIEPWIARRPLEPRELLLGVAVVPGVVLVVGGIPGNMIPGLISGIASAVFVAIFGACNKRMVDKADAFTVTCLELGAGTLFLTMLAPMIPHQGPIFPIPDARDTLWLAVLAFGCTLLPFVLALNALRHVSAFAMQFATNLEPVYAIILAIVLLGEQHEVDAQFYIGVAVVILAVCAYPILRKRPVRKPAGELLGTAEAHNVTE